MLVNLLVSVDSSTASSSAFCCSFHRTKHGPFRLEQNLDRTYLCCNIKHLLIESRCIIIILTRWHKLCSCLIQVQRILSYGYFSLSLLFIGVYFKFAFTFGILKNFLHFTCLCTLGNEYVWRMAWRKAIVVETGSVLPSKMESLWLEVALHVVWKLKALLILYYLSFNKSGFRSWGHELLEICGLLLSCDDFWNLPFSCLMVHLLQFWRELSSNSLRLLMSWRR